MPNQITFLEQAKQAGKWAADAQFPFMFAGLVCYIIVALCISAEWIAIDRLQAAVAAVPC